MFDCHCHVQFPAYDVDREAVIARAQKLGVKMIAVGTQLSTSEAGIELSKKYPSDIWATVGYHPNHVMEVWHHDKKEQAKAEREVFDEKVFLELAKNPRVVGIGECGLDYYRGATPDEKERQKEIYLAHVRIAESVGKPLMIHCRPSKGTDDAYEDLLKVSPHVKVSKILHFYVGTPAMTKKLVATDSYFTFGGVITFSRDYDEAIKLIPIDRILTETDSPYVAPEPHRGKRNEPSYVIEVVKKLSLLKGVSESEMSKVLDQNAKTVFKI